MTYSNWVDSLKKKGWLRPVFTSPTRQDHIKFEPGPALTVYLAKEKVFRAEMASRKDVFENGERIKSDLREEFATKKDFLALKDQVSALAHELHKANQPPDDDVKREIRKNAPQELLKLVK